MLYRNVPKTGDHLSVLGFGAMRLPLRRGGIDEKRSAAQICSAIDQGVNYVDTAVPYHMGKSEPFLGKLLSENGYRQKIRLATKLPHWSARTKAEMDEILDEQLKKLRTDHIDYYLIHALNGSTWEKAKEKGVTDFLDDALTAGKILNAGFSFHGATEDFNPIVDDYDWTFCQIQYNFLDTKNQAGTAGMRYAASKELAVMVMEPLRGGNLSKTPPKEVQAIWDQSETRRTPTEWSFRWILNHPEITVVLSGMNEEAHIHENLRIASEAHPNSLSEDDLKRVREATRAYRRLMKVGCTGCQYCMPCPSGVNIPRCFEFYNAYHTFGDKSAKLLYLGHNGGINGGEPAFASQCADCEECVEKCPQSLPIPELLKDVANDMEGIMTKPLLWVMKRLFKVKR